MRDSSKTNQILVILLLLLGIFIVKMFPELWRYARISRM